MGIRWTMGVVWCVVVGCGGAEVLESQPLGDPATEAPAEAPPAPPHGAAPDDAVHGGAGGVPSLRQGVVKEAVEQDGKTYARLDICGTETWVAGPATAVKAGQNVVVLGTTEATDVKVEALGRTLPTVLTVAKMAVSVAEVECGPGSVNGISATMAGGQLAPPTLSTQGSVLETMNSGGYTYARVDFCGTEGWVAGPQTGLTVGQTIATPEGATTMVNFESKTLGRSFASIQFLSVIPLIEGAPTCP